MLLFKQRFWDPVRSGKVTLTFRAWRTQRVSVGKTYRCGGIGRLVVRAVDETVVGDISPRELRAAGFSSIDDLRDALGASKTRVTKRTRIYRIRFAVVADDAAKPARKPSAADVRRTLDRLGEIDVRSRRGPWTGDVLRLIADAPGVVSTRLAPRVRRERQAFKTDVRRLKALGLTRSLEIGYELTALGRAVVERM